MIEYKLHGLITSARWGKWLALQERTPASKERKI